MSTCPVCGSPNNSSDLFCSFCGAPLNPPVSSDPAPSVFGSPGSPSDGKTERVDPDSSEKTSAPESHEHARFGILGSPAEVDDEARWHARFGILRNPSEDAAEPRERAKFGIVGGSAVSGGYGGFDREPTGSGSEGGRDVSGFDPGSYGGGGGSYGGGGGGYDGGHGGGGRRQPSVPAWFWIGLVAILAISGMLVWFLRPHDTDLGEVTPSTPDPIQLSIDQISKAAAPYEDENGNVPPEQVQAAIEAVYTAARNSPQVTSCERDPYSVVIRVPSGPSYVYCPTAAGPENPSVAGSAPASPLPSAPLIPPVVSPTPLPPVWPPVSGTDPTPPASTLDLRVITIQPYDSENREIARVYGYSHDLDAPDLVAQDLVSRDPAQWRFESSDNVNDSSLTMERILTLDQYQVILWHGHGAYSTYTGYSLCLNIPWSEELGARYGLNDDNCCRMMDGTVALKPAYFAQHFAPGSFDNAYIYLGTCYSGKDPEMAQVFLDLGAAAVFVNSESISRRYNLDMLHLVGDTFLAGADSPLVQSAAAGAAGSFPEDPSRWMLMDSLMLGQLCYGAEDPWSSGEAAKVVLYCPVGVQEWTYWDWISHFAGAAPVGPGGTPDPDVSPSPTPGPTPTPTPRPTPTPTPRPTPTPTPRPTPTPTPRPTPTPTPRPTSPPHQMMDGLFGYWYLMPDYRANLLFDGQDSREENGVWGYDNYMSLTITYDGPNGAEWVEYFPQIVFVNNRCEFGYTDSGGSSGRVSLRYENYSIYMQVTRDRGNNAYGLHNLNGEYIRILDFPEEPNTHFDRNGSFLADVLDIDLSSGTIDFVLMEYFTYDDSFVRGLRVGDSVRTLVDTHRVISIESGYGGICYTLDDYCRIIWSPNAQAWILIAPSDAPFLTDGEEYLLKVQNGIMIRDDMYAVETGTDPALWTLQQIRDRYRNTLYTVTFEFEIKNNRIQGATVIYLP